ncbi:MAG: glutamine-hydrolyzing GMP synthase [Balneolaceae bacterium]|nr:MAG: glutamine-hydrolyzing GMP synthase [Balneolaceae bacterium]
MDTHHEEWILILDFGSQYTQLIARRIRELNVYCEIHPYNTSPETFSGRIPKGIVLSGGPKSVYDQDAPVLNLEYLGYPVPVLGVCYGLQSLAHAISPDSVSKAEKREFGRAKLIIDDNSDLLFGVRNESIVWMSHGDHINHLPEPYRIIAHTSNAPVAAVKHQEKPVYGVQFHPEVVHTEEGHRILENFVSRISGCTGSWTTASFIETEIELIRNKVGDDKVICGLSGGVDSTVVATLLHRAIGEKLLCIFVDNGLLRKNEYKDVLETYQKHLKLPVRGIDASEKFLKRLSGVSDPEKKRVIIGNTFIDVFDEVVSDQSEFKYLAQGTLYPDVIESVSFKGPSATIKSHHNVGGLPEKMNLQLIEPVRELFKDEVRNVGRELGIPESFISRHPFPGPGMGIRVLGEITREKLNLLKEADAIFIDALKRDGFYDSVWQALAVLLPVKSVGVMGDERTYEYTIALRAVTSVDGMTADWAHLPFSFLADVSNRIINEVRGVNRVVYDISSKPPSTIEWE